MSTFQRSGEEYLTMQGEKKVHDFSDPFAGLGGLVSTRRHRSLLSSFLRGRDPFDDPVFARPFGSLLGGIPFGGTLDSRFFGQGRRPFPNGSPFGFIEQQLPLVPQTKKRRGAVIEEIISDAEDVPRKNEMRRRHGRLEKEPDVEDADDTADERKNKQIQFRNEYNGMSDRPSQVYSRVNQIAQQPGSHLITFHSSSITFGGIDGPYYTKSTTWRTGSDGLTFQEHKEADGTTGRATHQISKGLHNKGHTLTRKLSSDGRVDSMQTLHNLNQDELSGFEETWERKANKHLLGLSERFDGFASSRTEGSRERLALPSTEESPLMKPWQQKGKRTWSEMASDVPASQPQCSGSRKAGNRKRG